MSTLLFNATLDYAFFKWKTRLNSHGRNIDNASEYLTNIRFADDILLMAKSKEELSEMMAWLVDELFEIGLEVNKAKTKLLTTECNYFKEGTSAAVCIRNQYYHVLGNHEWHKYLGKYLCFGSFHRHDIEVQHQIGAA